MECGARSAETARCDRCSEKHRTCEVRRRGRLLAKNRCRNCGGPREDIAKRQCMKCLRLHSLRNLLRYHDTKENDHA